jgi:hypothetical protein
MEADPVDYTCRALRLWKMVGVFRVLEQGGVITLRKPWQRRSGFRR